MKKIISLLVAATLLVATATSCSKTAKADENKIKVVATVFPEYDWVSNIIKGRDDKFDLTLLLDGGTDLHSFEPTVDDIMKVTSCDLFIYVGGESDEWVEDALKESKNADLKTINLMETLGDSRMEEELKEGMQAHEEEEEEEGEEEVEYDEHVWLSLKAAKTFCNKISDELCAIDPDGKDTYSKNASDYVQSLDTLDQKYEDLCADASVDTLIFADRFPFRYMVEDYGLDYYAAFIGCSAETEASFETISFLSKKVDELGLKNIFVIETSDQKIAQTVRDNSTSKDQNILVLDSMQKAGSKELQENKTYLGIMEDNLKVLETALK